MICVCGHGEDEHEKESGPCHGKILLPLHRLATSMKKEPCRCAQFEDSEEEDN